MNEKKDDNIYIKRVHKIGICCLILSFIIMIINIIQDVKWFEYIIIVVLIISGLIFLYSSNKIKRNNNLNQRKKKQN